MFLSLLFGSSRLWFDRLYWSRKKRAGCETEAWLLFFFECSEKRTGCEKEAYTVPWVYGSVVFSNAWKNGPAVKKKRTRFLEFMALMFFRTDETGFDLTRLSRRTWVVSSRLHDWVTLVIGNSFVLHFSGFFSILFFRIIWLCWFCSLYSWCWCTFASFSLVLHSMIEVDHFFLTGRCHDFLSF